MKKKKSGGVLFPHQKTKERSPDMTGKIEIRWEDLKQLTDQNDDAEGVVIANVALWYYTADPDNERGPFVSLVLTPPYRPQRKALDDDPETTFDNFFQDVRRHN